MIHKYIRCAKGNDDNLKRVLDYLDQENLAENTIVIYTSDQGYWLGQHGLYDKRLILETSIRMPFLIRYPKVTAPGSVSNDLCANIDVAPTLLELAGIAAPASMQGASMVPILKGQSPKSWRKSQFYTYWGAPDHYGVRTKRYTYTKVATSSDGIQVELFDREKDPTQTTNVAGDPNYRQTLVELEAELAYQIQLADIPSSRLPGPKK
ncbi:MAG: sulfatase/phosphatase domain-containing protein [Planctomycetota bacterium]